MPRMKPLRVALGIVAVLVFAGAAVGAIMSVTINWAFALTIAGSASYASTVALCFAAIECTRILMPLVKKGLETADLKGFARIAGLAFWVFTTISVSSAFGFFAMNRADATAQRGSTVSQTASYKAELDAITRRMERAPDMRSVAEVEAELATIGRHDPRRGQLQIERAAAEQREKDLKRLPELRAADAWKVVVVAKDAQLETLADALPWDRDLTVRVGAVVLILLAVFALELLIGFTPSAAIMLLVWACRRSEAPRVATGEPAAVKVPPTDHIQKFLDGCTQRSPNHATQWKQIYGGYTKFCAARGWQPLNEFRLRPALLAALGSVETERRKEGMFWRTLVLKPQWLPEEAVHVA
jgi:hypothetical protein